MYIYNFICVNYYNKKNTKYTLTSLILSNINNLKIIFFKNIYVTKEKCKSIKNKKSEFFI